MDHQSYNRLAVRVLDLEEENKRLRRLIVNNFRLICEIGQRLVSCWTRR